MLEWAIYSMITESIITARFFNRINMAKESKHSKMENMKVNFSLEKLPDSAVFH
jgi:hypothetical protein